MKKAGFASLSNSRDIGFGSNIEPSRVGIESSVLIPVDNILQLSIKYFVAVIGTVRAA